MEHRFKDNVVIVTGAGVGIGYEMCRSFAAEGAHVALNDLDGDLAHRAAAEINAAVGAARVQPFALDVADIAAVQAMINRFADQHGRLDVVIANAGVTMYGSFLDYTVKAFDWVVGVNLRGSYFTAQAAAKKMLALEMAAGRIIFMASATGVHPFPNLGTYGMTKAGLIHLTRVLAVELGPHGITVNAISPGATLTSRNLEDDPNYVENWAEINVTRRVGQVEDVAAAALFLASPAAKQITGQTLGVDGGWSLRAVTPE